MALLMMEGFELMNSTTLDRKYDYHFPTGSPGLWNSGTPAGRFGGNCIVGYGGYAPNLGLTGLPLGTSLVMGYALKSGGLYVNGSLFTFSDVNGVTQVNVTMTSDGYIHVFRNAVEIGSVLSSWPTPNVWRYMECKVVIDPTVGSVELHMDEVTLLTLTNVNTQGTAAQTIWNAVANPTSGIVFDDMYICDLTGGVNNNFLGDCVVESVVPTSAGTYSQFTPLSGANYTNVDEGPYNGDTDYVYSNTLNNIDTYHFAPFTTGGIVRGVSVNLFHRKDNAGVRKVSAVCRSGGSDYVGSGQFQTFPDYFGSVQFWDVNPYTTTAFTMTELNAAEFGFKLIV